MENQVMNQMDETVKLNRMESTDDKQENKCLFEMYANLIKPLKSIENKMDATEQLQYQGYLIRTKKKDYIWKCFLIGIILFGITFLMAAVVSMGNIKAFFIGIIISGLVGGGTMLISLPISRHDDADRKRKLSELETQLINDFKNEINNDIDIIKPYLQYVPPAYRTSHALGYFVDSYVNVRVENLSEAVKAYDEYVRHQNLQQKLRKIDGRLQQIAYMQNCSLSRTYVGVNLGVMSLWL